jgi:hypothetical protein
MTEVDKLIDDNERETGNEETVHTEVPEKRAYLPILDEQAIAHIKANKIIDKDFVAKLHAAGMESLRVKLPDSVFTKEDEERREKVMTEALQSCRLKFCVI